MKTTKTLLPLNSPPHLFLKYTVHKLWHLLRPVNLYVSKGLSKVRQFCMYQHKLIILYILIKDTDQKLNKYLLS